MEGTPKPGFADEALPQLESVYRFALRLCAGREDEAEDLAQDTFLRAYRAWDTFARGTNCRAWLLTICRNAFLRGEQRRGRVLVLPEEAIDAVAESIATIVGFADVEADPERAFFDSFVDEEVMRAVDGLPAPFREAVVLSDLEGLSYPETAEVLGLPVGTVKSRLFRGRRLLQEALREYALEMGYIRPGGRG